MFFSNGLLSRLASFLQWQRRAKVRSFRWYLHIHMVVLLVLFSSPVFAGGPIHGARAAGMGTAFIGLADDPSALLHNPAGITQLAGSQIYGGITVLSSSSKYHSGANEEKTQGQLFFPPHLYLTSRLGLQKFVFGLGLDSPFGIGGRKWDSTGATRYLSTENSIATFSVNPTLAWQATPKLSLAVGVSYLRGDMLMERMVDQHLVMAGDGRMKIDADGGGWGYNLGLLYRIDDRWQIGLAYRSKVTVDFTGTLSLTEIAPALQPLFGDDNFKSKLCTQSTFPEIYSMGVAHHFSDRLVVAMDLELVRWSSFDQMDIHLARHVSAGGITDTTIVLDWSDSWQFKVGGEYQLNPRWRLRGGYAYIQGVVPDATLGPENPDANQHNVSVGTGWSGEKLFLDFFYNFGWFRHQTVKNNLLSGDYRTVVHYFGISTGYRF